MKNTKYFKLSPIFLSITSFFPIYVNAEVIIDDKNSGTTSMTAAANGVPVIDINNPDNHGVSHNKFTDFNVDKEGLIFNNSTIEGVSKIGGFIINNPNIQSEATAIISEVTGAKGTHLNGTMEIFGRKADLIIANENGITVNGLSTLNANNLTLSTGSVHRGADGSVLLSVDRGNISIEGLGVNTAGVSYFDLISRTAMLTGEINGQADLKIVTGKNDYNLSKRAHSVRTGTAEDTPAIAISGSQLGSMYGNRIQLISTESGAGVHHDGSIIGSQGIDITADGDIHLTSLAADKGGLHVSGKTISLAKNDAAKLGGISAHDDIILKALANVELNADILSQQGSITINANNLLQSSAKLLANSGQKRGVNIPGIKINVANKYLLSGNLYAVDSEGKEIKNALISLEDGKYIVKVDNQKVASASVYSNASISAIDNLSINAKEFTNQGGMVSTRKGTLEINITESILNDGIVQAGGSLILHGKKFKNLGVVNTTDNLHFTLGNIENSGALYAKNIDIKTSTLLNDGVILADNGDLSIVTTGNDESKNNGLLQGGKTKLTSNSSIINKGKILAGDELIINATSVENTHKIVSDNTIRLNISKGLTNSGNEALISAAKNLSITSIDKNNKTNLENINNAVLQSGGGLSIDNINNISNSSLIAAKVDLHINQGEHLVNDGGKLQGQKVSINNYNELTNKNGAVITASSSLEVRDVTSLNNDNSTLASYESVLIDNINDLTNNLGKIIADHDLTIKNIGLVNNKFSTIASSSGNVYLESIANLKNTVSSTISAAGDMIIKDGNELRNSEDSSLISKNNITIENIDKVKNIGSIMSQVSMIVKDINSLVNTTDTALIQSGSVLFENIKTITNENSAAILAENNLDLEKVEKLLNKLAGKIQATKATLSVDTLKNQDYLSSIIADDEIRINANSIINNNEAAILAKNKVFLKANSIDNGEGSDINGAQYNIDATRLVNKGTISSQNANSGDSIKVDLLDNQSGDILSDGSLSLTAQDFIVDDQSNIFSAKALSLKLTNDFNNESIGKLASNGILDISTLGKIDIHKKVESYGAIKLTASGIYNHAAIVSMNEIYLNAASIVNDINTLLFSIKDVHIDATKEVTNNAGANILTQGNLTINADVVKNIGGTIRAEGDINIDANQLENASTYKNRTWDIGAVERGVGQWKYSATAYDEKFYAIIDLPMLVSDIALDKKAEISSGGNLSFNKFRRMEDKVGNLINRGGLIQAKKDIKITGNLNNTTDYLQIDYYDILRNRDKNGIFNPLGDPDLELSFKHSKLLWNNDGSLHFNNFLEVLNYIYGKDAVYTTTGGDMTLDDPQEKFSSALVELSDRHARLNTIMKSLFGEHWRTDQHKTLMSKWKSLSANAYQKLKDKKYYFLPADKGEISAGGEIMVHGGGVNNGIDPELASGFNQLNKITDVEVGDKTVQTLDQGYEVSFSTKKLEEIKQGISVLPTLEDLVKINGMFQQSQAFLNLQNPDIAIGDRKDSPIVPMYETRIEMIDMSKYYGSDYFFDKVGYKADEPVIVIGDNYFINELLRRQINHSIGAALSIKYGVDGADLIKNLFDNSGLAVNSAEGDFEVGRALTRDQMDNLSKDIVWFVTENIDGVDVLVPRLYLAKTTIDAISGSNTFGAASMHAGEKIVLDVKDLNNYNGSISSGGNVSIKAEGDINNASSGMSSGIKADGSVSVTSTNGDINNSGAYIKAGDTVRLSADEGDVNIISSVGRDTNGDQVIGLYDDDISAGKHIDISGKNVNITAVDLNTGDNPDSTVKISSTEGSVNFNDIHELNSTSKHSSENTSFFSSRTIDEKDITAKSKTSSINTKGDLTINSSEDIIFSGGDYNAGSASLSADKDITVKTSQDHHIHERKVTETDFVVALSADIPGMAKKEMNYSGLDGTTHSDSNNYQSGGSNAQLNTASAKRPGAAPTADTLAAKVGIQTTESTTHESTTTNKNSQFNFGNGASIVAGKTADIGGMDLTVSENAAASIIAGDVQSTKYKDTYTKTDSYKETFVGMKAEGHSAVIDSVNKYANIAGKSTQEDMEVDALRTAGQVAGDISNVVFNDLAGASTKFGWSELNTQETQTSTSENKNTISGGQVNIISEKDIVLHGTELTAQQVNMNANGDLILKAAESTENSSSSSSTHEAGISLSGGVAATGAGLGASLDYSGSVSSADSESKSYTNATVTAQQVNINTGKNTTLEGANISAGEANMNIGGNLTVESKQDTSLSVASSENWAASVGASISTSGLLPNASANYGAGGERHDMAVTKQQSGITTAGDVNIHTQGDLIMTGGHIVSSQGTGKVKVDGDVTTTVLEDHIDSEGMYQGGGGGISYKGMPTANYYNDTLDEIHTKIDQNNTINVKTDITGQTQGSINTDVEKAVVVTEDKKIAGNNISVTVSVPKLPAKKGSYDVNNDSLTPKPSKNSSSNNTATPQSSTQNTMSKTPAAGDHTSTSHGPKPGQKPSVSGSPVQQGTVTNPAAHSSTSHGPKPGQKPSISGSPVQQGTVTNHPTAGNSTTTTPAQSSTTGGKGKWPTVTPSTGYIGGTGSSSRPDGMNTAKPKPQTNVFNRPTTVKNDTTQKPHAASTHSTTTGKWPTVTPSTGYIGGTGSSSRPDGMNTAKPKPQTNVFNRPTTVKSTTDTQKTHSTPTQSTVTGGKSKWPTVTPSTGYIGGTGSASRPDGMNTAKPKPQTNVFNRPTTVKSTTDTQKTHSTPTQSTATGGKSKWPTVTPSTGYIGGTGSASRPGGMNTTESKAVNFNRPSTDKVSPAKVHKNVEYRAESPKQKLPSQKYDGKSWPSVTESKRIIGGTGSSSRIDGMNSARTKSINDVNKGNIK